MTTMMLMMLLMMMMMMSLMNWWWWQWWQPQRKGVGDDDKALFSNYCCTCISMFTSVSVSGKFSFTCIQIDSESSLQLLKAAATVLSIPLNKKKENSQVNKLGIISKKRSHVRNGEAVNLILIDRPTNQKQESLLSVKFLCYLLKNNWKWSVPPKAFLFLTVVSGIFKGF